MTSQKSESVFCAKNGSIKAVAQSGRSVMSDSLIAFHPAIDEPSNIVPSVRNSSLTSDRSNVTCCHFPRGSVKRRSTNLTSFSLMSFRTVLAFAMDRSLVCRAACPKLNSDRVRAGFAGADADHLFHVEDEDLAVADSARPRRLLNGVERGFEPLIRNDDFDLHLGKKIDDVFSAAIKFGVAFLAAEAARFHDGDALDADFLQRLLHLVELERLDHRFDLFQSSLHRRPLYPLANRQIGRAHV